MNTEPDKDNVSDTTTPNKKEIDSEVYHLYFICKICTIALVQDLVAIEGCFILEITVIAICEIQIIIEIVV